MEMGLPEEVKPDILRSLQLEANIRTCVMHGLSYDASDFNNIHAQSCIDIR